MTVANLAIPDNELADFCRRNGVRSLALFGSALSDHFGEASDVDILVQFRPGERVGFFKLAQMEEHLSRLLQGRKVDLRTPGDLSRYFRDEVIRTARVLYSES